MIRATVIHGILLGLIAGLGLVAFDVGYPNVSALFAAIAVGAVAMFEIASRISQGRGDRHVFATARTYCVLVGLTAVYLASDAHVLAMAHRAYPADALWFLLFLGSVGFLAIIMSMRSPERTDMFVLEPRFTGNGIGLFVVAVGLQLLVLTALGSLPFLIMAFRVTVLAISLWFVVFGVLLGNRAITWIGGGFVVINLLTAYLDLLWESRATIIFQLGGCGIAALSLACLAWWIHDAERRQS